jgi:hypothetical protein
MSAEIFQFPLGDTGRCTPPRKPRPSKNDTPRAPSAVDGRKLRGSPLRDNVSVISFAVTISGKMHTADLKGEPLPRDAAGWLETLRKGSTTARYVADELDKAFERLKAEQLALPSAFENEQ